VPESEQKRSNLFSQNEIDELLAQDISEPPEEDLGWGESDEEEEAETGEEAEDQWGEPDGEDFAEEPPDAEVAPAMPAAAVKTVVPRSAIFNKILRSKWVWGCVSGLILCLVVAVALMTILPGTEDEVAVKHAIPGEAEGDRAAAGQVPLAPVSVQLNGFFALSAYKNKDVTYIEADISIYLTDSIHARIIEDHQSLFRELIFQKLSEAVQSNNWQAETEISKLKTLIQQALEQSLPEGSVRRVFLTSLRVV